MIDYSIYAHISLPCAKYIYYFNWNPILLSILIYRHVLPSLHFNENLRRDLKQTKDGKTYIHVTFPKFKMGEEVVREIAEPPSYGMTGCLLLLLLLFLLLLSVINIVALSTTMYQDYDIHINIILVLIIIVIENNNYYACISKVWCVHRHGFTSKYTLVLPISFCNCFSSMV